MTPAEGLRAAAQKIRDTAAAATPGPWHRPSYARRKDAVTADLPDGEAPMIWRGGTDPDGDREQVVIARVQTWDPTGEHVRARSGRDLDWIALASPAVAEPLAAWLEGMTRRHNLSPDADYPDRCIWCVEPWPCPDLRDALAVARAITGSAR